MQALSQRLQSPYTLRSVEEGRGSRGQQVEIRKPSTVDVVDQLPQGVESFLPHVASDSLQRFDFIENQHQSRIAGVFQDQQQPTKKAQSSVMVHVALYPCDSFHRCGDMGLPGQPAAKPFSGGMVIRPLSRRYARKAAANWGVARVISASLPVR